MNVYTDTAANIIALLYQSYKVIIVNETCRLEVLHQKYVHNLLS